MYGLDDYTGVPDIPSIPTAGTEQFFIGNTSILDPTTSVPDWWLNMVQDELLNIVKEVSTPNKESNTQVIEAIHSIVDGIMVAEATTPYMTLYQSNMRYASHPASFFTGSYTKNLIYKHLLGIPLPINNTVQGVSRYMSYGSLPISTVYEFANETGARLFHMFITATQATQITCYVYAVDDNVLYYVDNVLVASSSVFYSDTPRKYDITIPKGLHVFSIVTNNTGGKHPGEFYYYAVGDIIKNPYIKFVGED